MSGWNDIDEQGGVVQDDQADDMNLLVAKTFGTDAGQKVLAWMRDFYIERPCWEPGADSSLGMFREGQNSVVRDIEQRIRRAKNKS
jgi:hypothetical protein